VRAHGPTNGTRAASRACDDDSTTIRRRRDDGTERRAVVVVVERAMKVARTKAQLKHLKTKRKKAKDKKKRRALARGTTAAADAFARASERDDVEGGGDDAREDVVSARVKRSAVTARKRELRERIAELKSKRGKIGKKNFGRGGERKELTAQIKKLEAERAALVGGGGGDEDDAGENDVEIDDVVDEDVDMA